MHGFSFARVLFHEFLHYVNSKLPRELGNRLDDFLDDPALKVSLEHRATDHEHAGCQDVRSILRTCRTCLDKNRNGKVRTKERGEFQAVSLLLYPVAVEYALKTAVKLTVPGVAVVETLKDKLRGGVD
jgi:hypothetical protein